MKNTSTGITVEILNQEYRLIGEEEKYLQKVAGYVDKQLRLLQEETSSYTSGRLGILACLNIADQLQKQKNEHRNLIAQLLNTINKLIGEIDSIINVTQNYPEVNKITPADLLLTTGKSKPQGQAR